MKESHTKNTKKKKKIDVNHYGIRTKDLRKTSQVIQGNTVIVLCVVKVDLSCYAIRGYSDYV